MSVNDFFRSICFHLLDKSFRPAVINELNQPCQQIQLGTYINVNISISYLPPILKKEIEVLILIIRDSPQEMRIDMSTMNKQPQEEVDFCICDSSRARNQHRGIKSYKISIVYSA